MAELNLMLPQKSCQVYQILSFSHQVTMQVKEPVGLNLESRI